MTYEVLICPRAQRQIKALAPRDQDRLKPHILGLGANPRPSGVVAMHGLDRSYRLRVGDFRIVYTVHEDTVTILVLAVANRSEAYRASDIAAMHRDAREWQADQDEKHDQTGRDEAAD